MSALTSDQKLVRMANQIAGFFDSYPEATAIEGVREHISKFWSAKMRAAVVHIAAGDEGGALAPTVVKAVKLLKENQPA